jgi:hypothetical protein
MKPVIFILFCILFFFFSCQHALEKPDNLLSEEEMVAILTDIYLYKQSPENTPLSKDDAFDTYVSIFKAYNTTKEIFQNSYDYYYADIEAIQHIYDDVTDNLKDKLTKEQQQQMQEEEKEKVVVPDKK